MNIEQARFNMIEQQIRTWEVLDPEVLDLLGRVKREDFVPSRHRDLAFADLEIPLGHGESMMQPKVEARILQELSIEPHESVYEVGTGSGYLTALLASRARHVTSAEIYPDLKASAEKNLAAAGITNVTLLEGDSARAPLAESAFDVIVLTGSTPVVPQAFLDHLKPGGRLFAVSIGVFFGTQNGRLHLIRIHDDVCAIEQNFLLFGKTHRIPLRGRAEDH